MTPWGSGHVSSDSVFSVTQYPLTEEECHRTMLERFHFMFSLEVQVRPVRLTSRPTAGLCCAF